jgi:tellurite resistance protein
MNRRNFLVGSVATCAVVAVAGASVLVYGSNERFLIGLLNEMVGAFSMSEDDQRKFVTYFSRDYGSKKLMAVIELYRLKVKAHIGIARTDDELDKFERRLVTDFMVSTDYLRKQHQDNPAIAYLGPRVCGNPYAQFTGLPA